MTTADDVAAYLRGLKFHYVDEKELQEGIALALRKRGWPFDREVTLGRDARIDLLMTKPWSVGIEVKIGGTSAAALGQMAKYASSDRVASLVLVTDRMQAGVQPESIHGKPIVVVNLLGGLR